MSRTSTIQLFTKEHWPTGVKNIPQPPEQLYIEGSFPDPASKFLCVVGSRKYSSYGKEVCEKLIAGLRGYPIVIISGLAIGIDSIAHESALKSGLVTIGMPGSGLSRSVIYPRSNTRLADQIVKSGGALISEYEPNFMAMLHTFIERNRLMVAFSQAVLIIEAGSKSGTLITARLALDYNREVFAVPGSIYSKTSEGAHSLLKMGARPVTSSADILEALGFERASDNQKILELEYHNCSDAEKKILKLLAEPVEKDELVRQSNLATDQVNSLIGILEIKGLIKESCGMIQLV